jgi:hypothetical protein
MKCHENRFRQGLEEAAEEASIWNGLTHFRRLVHQKAIPRPRRPSDLDAAEDEVEEESGWESQVGVAAAIISGC